MDNWSIWIKGIDVQVVLNIVSYFKLAIAERGKYH